MAWYLRTLQHKGPWSPSSAPALGVTRSVLVCGQAGFRGVLGAPESLYEDIIKDLGSNVRRVSPAREGKLQAVEARVEELESTRPKLKCTRMR
ncbi:g6966 [Coccomyxa viridis]|uniref:G6966 protein n=1 Tax=Coccomyxa viridis TaxID=1274662 RepID=A0ABP1FWM4_9CHLO